MRLHEVTGMEGLKSALLVKAVRRAVENNFKHGGPRVLLHDDEVGEPMQVRGVGLAPDGDVKVHVTLRDGPLQTRTYTVGMVDDGLLHLEPGSGGTVLRYTERST